MKFFYSTRKTIKIQDICVDIFQTVDPVSTTEVYKNEALKTCEIDIPGPTSNKQVEIE